MSKINAGEVSFLIRRHVYGVYLECEGHEILLEPDELMGIAHACFDVLSARRMSESLSALERCLRLAKSSTLRVEGGRICECCGEIL